MTANAHILRAAQAAKRVARWNRIRKSGSVVTRAALVLGIFVAGHQAPRTMRLPEPGEIVVAWTGDNWHRAYCDEGGEFRDAETGLGIGQVRKWTRP